MQYDISQLNLKEGDELAGWQEEHLVKNLKITVLA